MSRKFLITGLTSAAIVATMGIAYAQSQDESALANTNVNGTQNSLGHDQAGPPAMPAEAAAMSATYGSSYDEQGRLAAGATGTATSAPAGGDMNTDNSASVSANMGATTSDTANNPYSASSTAATTGTASAAGSTMGSDAAVTDSGTDPATRARLASAGAGAGPDSSGQAWVIAGQGSKSSDAGSTSSSTTTAETRVDLNSANERPYNMASDPVGNNFREGHSQGAHHAGSASNWNGSDNASAASGEMRAPRADRN